MFRSLLVPLDSSVFGEHALPVAHAIASRSGATLHLVHVHVPVSVPRRGRVADTAERVFLIAPEGSSITSPLGYVLRRQPNVEVLEGYTVREIVGHAAIEELVLVRDEQPLRLGIDRAFVALFLTPNSAPVRDIVATDDEGFIVINAHHETSLPGLFAAGDVTTRFCEQVLVAIGDGARAAMNAYDYLVARRLVSDQKQEPLRQRSVGDEQTA